MTPGTTIERTVYNTFVADVETDLNAARPIIAGGTGATNADQALVNLSAEKATQLVTNYDSHLWRPGSFRSDAAATGAPNSTSKFAGVCYIGEALANPPTNQNVVIEARDQSGTDVPGFLWIREKKVGVWSAWTQSAESVAVRYDVAQSLTDVQKTQARSNIYAAPFDAMAYNGMQVNGSMEVSQEKGTTGISPTGTPAYIADGWLAAMTQTSSGTGWASAQTAAGPANFSNAIYIGTNGAATFGTGDYAQLVQNIEGYRVARLGYGTASAQPITIGFWVVSSFTGTFCVSVRNNALDRTYVTNVAINAAATWEYKTITIPGDTTGTWRKDNGIGLRITFAFAGGTTYRTTANVWTAGNQFATPQISNFWSAANTMYLAGLIVLPGTQAPTAAQSPLIMRPFDQELVTCMRYYEVLESISGYPIFAMGVATATTQANMWCPLLVKKRVIPSWSYSELAHFNIARNGWAVASAPSALTAQYHTLTGVQLQAVTSSLAPPESVALTANNVGASARLFADARL